jgi:pilus assembly protein Flp/PilA
MYQNTLHIKKQMGQGLVEYALILVLVAIVIIAALMILGPIVGNVFSKVNSSLSGVAGGGSISAVELSGCYTTTDAICASDPNVSWVPDCSCPGTSSTTCGYRVDPMGAFTCP